MPNEKGTTLYKIQKKFQNIFGFTLPLFHGRGILNCGFIQPSCYILSKLTMLQITGACFRTADRSSQSVSLSHSHVNNEQVLYHLTVGRPVHVQKTDNPTVEQIREVQEAYIAELMR
jgi:Diacylglycerol acyltransferase